MTSDTPIKFCLQPSKSNINVYIFVYLVDVHITFYLHINLVEMMTTILFFTIIGFVSMIKLDTSPIDEVSMIQPILEGKELQVH